MAEVARGSRDHLEPLVRRYAGPLLTLIRRLVADPHLAEDLFQDTFVSVWKNRAMFDPTRRFKPWLYRIAVNHCRAAMRRRRLRMMPSGGDAALELAPSREPASATVAAAVETTDRVAAAVAMLPDEQREVVLLRIYDNLAYGAIARIVGRGESTVRSQMFHALRALRRRLEDMR
ncbi:sigma-70 family RNA polymerase sigma factor [Planctomycetales bacterium ZRK34]|nr:sigma-70 family RNA polymerase sigma factor [Planctomycetales bacterium ZRK34]